MANLHYVDIQGRSQRVQLRLSPLVLAFRGIGAASTVGVASALTALCTAPVYAQEAAVRQERVVVSGHAEPVLEAENAQLSLGATIKDSAQSLNVMTQGLLKEADAKSLARTLSLDASLSDAYNATGYIENLQIRGFVLDSVNNYQRNGLPTLNYAPFAAETKSQIEVLKGVSGLQAAVSAPGGLVNYRVKTPTTAAITELNAAYSQSGGALAHLDLSRSDANKGLAVRVNALHETLKPRVLHAEGSRSLLSAYLTYSMSPNTKLALDLEWQRKSQLEQPGFGLLNGTDLPRIAFNDSTAIDPRTNMNAQPWSLPFEQQFFTAAFTLKHALSDATQLTFAAQSQRLRINDRIAFPDGSYPIYPGAAANGDMDLYDYRSENERRSLNVLQAGVTHRFALGSSTHTLQAQVQRMTNDFSPQAMQAYNWVGVTNEFTPQITLPDPTLTYLNRPNHESSTSLLLADAMKLTPSTTLYLGLRHSNIKRSSALSDGTESTAYLQQITTPNLGLSWQLHNYLTGYISAGQGVESEVVPNRPADFANAGEALPALKSRQFEVGMKWQVLPRLLATMAVFDINKPYAERDVTNQRMIAGAKRAKHSGVEMSATGAVNAQLNIAASAMWLNARYTQSHDAALIGRRVTNVVPFTAALFAGYKLEAIKGLAFNTKLRYDAEKTILTSSDVKLPSSTQWDLGLRYRQAVMSHNITWRLAVENALNRAYWKEAPSTSWGGVYLFPGAARTVSLSAQMEF